MGVNMKTRKRFSCADLTELGLLVVGENTVIDEDVWLCHPHSGGYGLVTIGDNCIIRAGTVIYSDVTIGNGCNFGQHAIVREYCIIGDKTSIGTHVTVENNTTIGNGTSIETGSHITAFATIGDNVFIGAEVVTNNDFGMKYKREGHGLELKGPTIKNWARIGSSSVIMSGVMIGKNSVINSGEVVHKNVPDGVLYFRKRGEIINKKRHS
jgi:acetyltransferase-like isoleucine patch superfamily enzyme